MEGIREQFSKAMESIADDPQFDNCELKAIVSGHPTEPNGAVVQFRIKALPEPAEAAPAEKPTPAQRRRGASSGNGGDS